MKYDAMGLLANAARSLTPRDGGTAYALYELADNLALVMRGEEGIDAFKRFYTGENHAPFIRKGLMPGEVNYPPFVAFDAVTPDITASESDAAESDAIERRAARASGSSEVWSNE